MRLCQGLRKQGRHRYEALGLSGSEETGGTGMRLWVRQGLRRQRRHNCGLESVSV